MEKIKIKNKNRLLLLESARKREMNILKTSIKITEQKLKIFEDKYDISSDEFYSKYIKGEMGDDEDIMLWAAEYQTLNKLKTDYSELKEVKFVA